VASIEEIRSLTALMRSDVQYPYWPRLRALLLGHGIDPAVAVFARSFEDDAQLEFGIIVAPDGRVFEFDYDYRERAEGEGDLTRWEEITQRWESRPGAEDIKAAFELHQKQHPSD
jgi:hypothetical protein